MPFEGTAPTSGQDEEPVFDDEPAAAPRDSVVADSDDPLATQDPSDLFQTGETVPDRGAGIWFMVFIASTIIRVCPSDTLSPTLTKLVAPGSGDK